MGVRIIDGIEALRELEPSWRIAEADGSVASVFTSFDWIESFWKVFGRGRRLWVVHDDSTGFCVAPLMITRAAGSLRRLELIGAGIHDYSDFITLPEDPEAPARLWSGIVASRAEWDSLRLTQIQEGSRTLHHAPNGPHRLTIKQSHGEACPVLELPATWDLYLASLGKNQRYDLGRYRRKLDRDFSSVSFRHAQSHEQVESMLDALFHLHSARWRKRGLPGVLATSRRRAFQRELAHRLLERDRLRLFSLELEGAPTAVLLNYCFGGRYFFYIGGFDPDRASYRPGTVLFGHAIRTAIEEGAREFDFLRGQEEYKYRFGALDRCYHDLVVTKNGFRSRATAAYVRFESKVIESARAFARGRVGSR